MGEYVDHKMQKLIRNVRSQRLSKYQKQPPAAPAQAENQQPAASGPSAEDVAALEAMLPKE